MRKSKYLILSSLYFNLNDELTNIEDVKKSFDMQNILDLLRFDNLTISNENQFYEKNINFVYFPNNAQTLAINSFAYNHIKYVNFSNCENMQAISSNAFKHNEIINLKLPKSITIIYKLSFFKNNIKYLDLSFYNDLEVIYVGAFSTNNIGIIKFPNNIIRLGMNAFYANNIKYLDLSNCKSLCDIDFNAFSDNPLEEIKILQDVALKYDIDTKGKWNQFILYYNRIGKRAGDYKYDENVKKWVWSHL